MMLLIVAGFTRVAKLVILIRLCRTGLLAHLAVSLKGAYFVTGNQTSRDVSRTIADAWPVVLGLIGRPSVKTSTTDRASLLARRSSAAAAANAADVNVVPFGHCNDFTLLI